jgi:hypothetical protein
MTTLVQHVLKVARDDIRLYFAPFKGAIKAVQRELQRPARQEHIVPAKGKAGR